MRGLAYASRPFLLRLHTCGFKRRGSGSEGSYRTLNGRRVFFRRGGVSPPTLQFKPPSTGSFGDGTYGLHTTRT